MKFWGRRGLTGLAIHTFPFSDTERYGEEGAQMTPLHVEEPAEQVLDLIYRRIIPRIARVGAGFPIRF